VHLSQRGVRSVLTDERNSIDCGLFPSRLTPLPYCEPVVPLNKYGNDELKTTWQESSTSETFDLTPNLC